MLFTKGLREGVRQGRIRCTIRIWMQPHVKVGGRYRMDDGHVVVDSIEPITLKDVTYDLARESGFESVDPQFNLRASCAAVPTVGEVQP